MWWESSLGVLLQLIAEKVLPESQCGFRKGRGCVDMIFTARQLFERAGNMMTLYLYYLLTFIRLMALSREGQWLVLQKYGVSPVMLSLIRSVMMV